jgi:hypothetical protein
LLTALRNAAASAGRPAMSWSLMRVTTRLSIGARTRWVANGRLEIRASS